MNPNLTVRSDKTHLLGQIIVNDQGVFAVVSEVLPHGAARVRSQVLQRSSVGGSGGHYDGVLDGVGIGQPLHQLSHRGSLLTDGNVDAVQLLLLIGALVKALLVDDCVDGDGGFAATQDSIRRLAPHVLYRYCSC